MTTFEKSLAVIVIGAALLISILGLVVNIAIYIEVRHLQEEQSDSRPHHNYILPKRPNDNEEPEKPRYPRGDKIGNGDTKTAK